MTFILGIETSCDETAVAIYSEEQGLMVHQIYSQIEVHVPYGGVVPELASRDHIRQLLPLTQASLVKAKLKPKALSAVAYTQGPGLIGALMVGASFAKSLAYGLGIPSIGVHHMEAHLMAVMLEKEVSYPFVALLVSGGHTLLVAVHALGDYQILGQSVDDAVGEAFDKTAKLLNLPYPGGPSLEKLARQGTPGRFHFTSPMIRHSGCDFSFSGLKTAVLHAVQKHQPLTQTIKADIAYAFEQAVVKALVVKTQRALMQTRWKQLVVAGGVSANQTLRQLMSAALKKHQVRVYYPCQAFCTDNAAMVSYTGYLHFIREHYDDALSIVTKPKWPLA